MQVENTTPVLGSSAQAVNLRLIGESESFRRNQTRDHSEETEECWLNFVLVIVVINPLRDQSQRYDEYLENVDMLTNAKEVAITAQNYKDLMIVFARGTGY